MLPPEISMIQSATRPRHTNPLRNVLEVRILVASTCGPDFSKSIIRPSRNDVQVKMEDALLRSLSSRGDQIHTVDIKCSLNRPTYLNTSANELSVKRRLYIPKIPNMSLWHHEGMTGRCGIQREECYPRIRLGHNLHGLV